ncbi:hypothetical protein M0804_011330 [Polistes exclamans]|nr:hypothetical protein M0804_011330 [Polistes exclamans]
MTVSIIKTTPEYVEFIKSKDLSVIHFFAPWAQQCDQINDVLKELVLLKDYENIKFAMLEAEKLPEISLKAGITAIPTVLLYKNEEIMSKIEGVNTRKLIDLLKLELVINNPTPLTEEETFELKLRKLLNRANCMVFMKGSREHPRCGYSRTMIALLDSHRTEYETFDILTDNAIREGLKKFSDWPTYPQLYIEGEFIGGLDIVKEMSNAGYLDSMLPKKRTS